LKEIEKEEKNKKKPMKKKTVQKKKDTEPSKEALVRNDWKVWMDKISYKGIVHNIPYLAFLVILCVWYISGNQKTIETQRTLNRKNIQLKELRWKYMDIKSQLMNAEMESEVIRNASSLGLKPLALPAFRLETESPKLSVH